MDRRLDEVVKMLEELKYKLPATSPSSSEQEHAPAHATPLTDSQHGRSGHSVELNRTKPGSQCDSTMAAHSEFAHDFVHKTVTTDPSMSQDPEMRKAFTALKDTIRSFGLSGYPTEPSFPRATPIQRPSLRGLEMPPIEKVVELIRSPNCKLQHLIVSIPKAHHCYTSNPHPFQRRGLNSADSLPRSDQHVMRTIGMFRFFPMDNLADLSLGVYFSQNYSETDFVTVNVGLYYLFQEYSSIVIETERDKFLQFADMCRNNVDTGLSVLPLYLPPTAGTVTALLCGVSFIKAYELLSLIFSLSPPPFLSD